MPSSPFMLPQIKISSPQGSGNGSPVQNVTDSRSPLYRRPGTVTGYTGHMSSSSSASSDVPALDNDEELPSPADKFMIRGYTGFRPTRRSVVGEPSIPSEEKQIRMRFEQAISGNNQRSSLLRPNTANNNRSSFSPASSPMSPSSPMNATSYGNSPSSPHTAIVLPTMPNQQGEKDWYTALKKAESTNNHAMNKGFSSSSSATSTSATSAASSANNTFASTAHEQAFRQFRTYAKHMDTLERYNAATQQLHERGQSPEMLLRIVQSKLSERVHSYASQQIRTRKLFQAFDWNNDGVLDESEFRVCLEKMNVQLDDIQVLALFAFFDPENQGVISWVHFQNHVMIQNPRGATGVLPKMITSISTEAISVAAGGRYPMLLSSV